MLRFIANVKKPRIKFKSTYVRNVPLLKNLGHLKRIRMDKERAKRSSLAVKDSGLFTIGEEWDAFAKKLCVPISNYNIFQILHNKYNFNMCL